MKIAVLDTGLGGLDILNKLLNKYPNNEYVYFCDNLNCPYGIKDKESVRKLKNKYFTYNIYEKVAYYILAGRLE